MILVACVSISLLHSSIGFVDTIREKEEKKMRESDQERKTRERETKTRIYRNMKKKEREQSIFL